jgi:hypothetical protein
LFDCRRSISELDRLATAVALIQPLLLHNLISSSPAWGNTGLAKGDKSCLELLAFQAGKVL